MKKIKETLDEIYGKLDELQETDEVQGNEDLMRQIGEAMGFINNAIAVIEEDLVDTKSVHKEFLRCYNKCITNKYINEKPKTIEDLENNSTVSILHTENGRYTSIQVNYDVKAEKLIIEWEDEGRKGKHVYEESYSIWDAIDGFNFDDFYGWAIEEIRKHTPGYDWDADDGDYIINGKEIPYVTLS